jgi:hypothetical protein
MGEARLRTKLVQHFRTPSLTRNSSMPMTLGFRPQRKTQRRCHSTKLPLNRILAMPALMHMVQVAVEPKVYGNTEVVVETRQIQRDLNAGNLPQGTTEVIPPVEVQTSLQSALDKAQKRFDNNPSDNNTKSLEKAKADIANSIRDGECLIQGCAPAAYVSPPRPVNPTPLVAQPSVPLVPVIIPAQAEPKQE